MHLILNNIIFSQQKAGGISLLWSEIIKYIINKNIKCLFVEYECAEKNVYRQQLDINYLVIKKNKYHNIGSLISNIFKIYTRQNYVCLSSDYNLQISKKIANVIVVHDFINELYEKRIFIKLFKPICLSAICFCSFVKQYFSNNCKAAWFESLYSAAVDSAAESAPDSAADSISDSVLLPTTVLFA